MKTLKLILPGLPACTKSAAKTPKTPPETINHFVFIRIPCICISQTDFVDIITNF